MDFVLFTLLFVVLGFAYTLSPVLSPGTRRAGGRSRSVADPFGEVVAEEAELEVAAGKLTREELQHLQSVAEPGPGPAEDEIEREIRSRRRQLRRGG